MEQHDSTEAPVCGCCRRVPISYLALDLDEPVEGWLSLFAQRGIEVAEDHLGRPSVGRRVLSHLLDEQREREARLASERAETAAAARPDVGVGVPALEGATAYESLLAPDAETPAQEFGYVPPPNFLEEALEAGSRHQAAERDAVRRRKEKK